jgi:hypothetical protein
MAGEGVPCPRGRDKCGTLYQNHPGLVQSTWTCTRCRQMWQDRDVQALKLARERKSAVPEPTPEKQLSLEDDHA